MGIYRPRWQLDGFFAQVPNAWLRDPRLTPKAMWILANMASQPPDRLVSVSLLCRQSAASHDAIYSGLRELEDCGYLTRVQERVKGQRLGEVVYLLAEPRLSENPPVADNPQPAGNPIVEEPKRGQALSDSETPASGNPIVTLSDSATPKENTRENTSLNTAKPDGFEAFWETYGLKVDKVTARKAWTKAVKVAAPEQIMAGVTRYLRWLAAQGDRAPHMKHPTTWLNQECWLNEYGPTPTAEQIARRAKWAQFFTDAGVTEAEWQAHELDQTWREAAQERAAVARKVRASDV